MLSLIKEYSARQFKMFCNEENIYVFCGFWNIYWNKVYPSGSPGSIFINGIILTQNITRENIPFSQN